MLFLLLSLPATEMALFISNTNHSEFCQAVKIRPPCIKSASTPYTTVSQSGRKFLYSEGQGAKISTK